MSTKTNTKTTGRSAIADVVAREYTIHLHKRVRFTSIPLTIPSPPIHDRRRTCDFGTIDN